MKIPYDGPTGSDVLRTGPLKIGDDWTGIFIRGDEALAFADRLEWLLNDIPGSSTVERLIKLFRSCRE